MKMDESVEKKVQKKEFFRRKRIGVDLIVAGVLAGILGVTSFVLQIFLSQVFFDLTESQPFYHMLGHIIMWPYYLFAFLVFKPLGFISAGLVWGLAFLLGTIGFPFIILGGWGAVFFFTARLLRKVLRFEQSLFVHAPAVIVVLALIVPFLFAIGPVSNQVDNCLSGQYTRTFRLSPLNLDGVDQDVQYDENGKAYVEAITGDPDSCFRDILIDYTINDDVDEALDFCVSLSDEKQVVITEDDGWYEPASATYQEYCVFRLMDDMGNIERIYDRKSSLSADFYEKYVKEGLPETQEEYKALSTEQRRAVRQQFTDALCRVYGERTNEDNEQACLGYFAEQRGSLEERDQRSAKQQDFSDLVGPVSSDQKLTFILRSESEVPAIYEQIEAYKNYQSNRIEGDAVLKTIKEISRSSSGASVLTNARSVSLMNQLQAGENVSIGQGGLTLKGTKDNPSWVTIDGEARYIEFTFSFETNPGGLAFLTLYQRNNIDLDSIQDAFDDLPYTTSYVMPVGGAEYAGLLYSDYENKGSEMRITNLRYGDGLATSGVEHVGYLVALESNKSGKNYRYEAFVTEEGFWPVSR